VRGGLLLVIQLKLWGWGRAGQEGQALLAAMRLEGLQAAWQPQESQQMAAS
jgi:hypothetical protein